MVPTAVERIHVDDRSVPSWVLTQHLQRYRWAARFVAGRIALDVACGSGYGTAMLARAGATRVIGADRDASAVASAAQAHAGPTCEFRVEDATALRLPDASVDVVVSFETIEHLPDDAAYLAEMRRVLRPGGTFLCSTPNRDVMNAATRITDGSFNPHHVREYDATEFRDRLLTQFARVHLLGQSPYPTRYARVLATIGRRWRMGAVRAHQAQKLVTSLRSRTRAEQWHDVQELQPGTMPEFFVARCER